MTKALTVENSGSIAWPDPPNAILPREVFAKGMLRLAGGQGKTLDPAALDAYWDTLAEVDPRDFMVGVRLANQRERYMTAAAVFEACDEAKRERRNREHSERQRIEAIESRRGMAEAKREAEARKAELEGIVAGWSAPPVDIEELKARVLVLLELRGKWILGRCLREATWSGTAADASVDCSIYEPIVRNDRKAVRELAREARLGAEGRLTFKQTEDAPSAVRAGE
jgi:hypothetical protein